jgi:hypothetical protein
MAAEDLAGNLSRPGFYPQLDVLHERRRPSSSLYSSLSFDPNADKSFIRYIQGASSRVDQRMGQVVYQHRKDYWMVNPYSVITGVPISVATERSESIEPTISSLTRAARSVDQALLIVNLNYTGDKRNDRQSLAELRVKAEDMQRDIIDMIPVDGNTDLAVAIDYRPAGATWPYIRTALHDTALGFTDYYSVIGIRHNHHKNKRRHDTPYLQVDGDTTVSEDVLRTVHDVLKNNKAVFVNGTLHYTGGIMEKSPREVAASSISTNDKLLYFAEHLRRRMFDHLPPVSLRGYLPEFGLGVKLGVISTFGGYEDHSSQNESLFLQVKAIEALREHWPTKMEKTEREFPEACIDSAIATSDGLEGLVYYAPYDEKTSSGYLVESSIRGIDANIKKYGRNGLVAWDQGSHYITFADFQESSLTSRQEPELTLQQALQFVNNIYSSFMDFGGELKIQDLHGNKDRPVSALIYLAAEEMSLEELLNVLFQKSNETLLFWRPKYIEKENRPKIAA